MARGLMWTVVAVSAAGGVAAGAQPTGWRPADVVFGAVFAGVLSLAGAYSRRWAWLVTAGIAVVAADGGPATICAVAAIAVCLLAVGLDVRSLAMGATAVGLASNALLRLPEFLMHGAPSIVAAVAALPVCISAYRYSPRRARRRARRIVAFACIGFLVVLGLGALAGYLAKTRVEDALQHAQAGFDAIGAGDRDTAVAELNQAASSFDDAQSIAGSWWASPIRVVPVGGQQLQAVETMAAEGRDLARSGSVAAGAIDYENLRIRGGRIDLNLVQLAQPPLTQTAKALDVAATELDHLSVDWLFPPLRARYQDFRQQVARALPAADLARDVATLAPVVLGADTPQNYLVLFGTPAETRELGGFVGNYALVTADKGKLTLTTSGRSLSLSDPTGKRGWVLQDGPYLEPFLPYRPTQFFGNVSASPNFGDVANVVHQLYAQATGQQVDGVFYMDPYALAALLDITGSITLHDANSTKLTEKNAAQVLLFDQYAQIADREDRVDFLDEATRLTFEQLTNGDLPKPASVAKALSPMVDEGHMFGSSVHPEVDALFRSLSLDGGAPAANGDDVLWVTQTNENPNKIDSYVHRDITYDATVRPDTGSVDANVDIKLTNSVDPALPDVVVDNAHGLPPGTDHLFLTVYSALRATSVTIQDLPVRFGAVPRFGLSAYTVVVDVPAGQTVSVKLKLTGVVETGDDYRLTVVRQPTVTPDVIDVTVTGRSGFTIKGANGLQLDGKTGKATVGSDRVTPIVAQFGGP